MTTEHQHAPAARAHGHFHLPQDRTGSIYRSAGRGRRWIRRIGPYAAALTAAAAFFAAVSALR